MPDVKSRDSHLVLLDSKTPQKRAPFLQNALRRFLFELLGFEFEAAANSPVRFEFDASFQRGLSCLTKALVLGFPPPNFK